MHETIHMFPHVVVSFCLYHGCRYYLHLVNVYRSLGVLYLVIRSTKMYDGFKFTLAIWCRIC